MGTSGSDSASPRGLKGRQVRFRVADSFLPSPAELVMVLHSRDSLAGEVVDISDDGSPDGIFAVVRVPEMAQPVIVRADRLLGAS
jgi:hypothetical protein